MVGFKHILGTILIAFVIPASAQPNFAWAAKMGGTSIEIGTSTTTDRTGNVYTTGYFEGTADFNPGSAVFNLTSAGNQDIYITKLDASGNFLWAKQIGGSQADFSFSISVDGVGNVYATGYFNATVDFDPGTGVYSMTSAGGSDIFILKLNSSGNFVWAKQIGGSLSDYGQALTADSIGNVYVTGLYRGNVDFNPGSGVFNLSSAGAGDIFVLKLNSAGNFIWARSMGGSSNDGGLSITVDPYGNILTTGNFAGTSDFNPGPGIYNLSSFGGPDIFISKLDSSGSFVWAKQMGGNTSDNGYSIVTDKSGNIYTTGSFTTTADFDPGTGVFNMISSGSNDVFISKLDSSGTFVWAKRMGSTSNDYGRSISCDILGNIYTTGPFYDTVDFDPGPGVFNMVSAGSADIFISKLNPTGNLVWAKQIGGSSPDVGYCVYTDFKSNIYATGYFDGTVDFDPGPGVFNLSSNASYDIFVLKLGQCLPTSQTISPFACTSYTSPSGKYTWTASNTYTDTVKNAGGCDSVITVNLTITGPSNGTDVLTACDSLQWIDGKTYYASNSTATHTLTGGAYNGCDSIVTLNLTIVNATTGTDKITACNAYKWIDGKTYTSSNNTATYTIAGGAANGCDSIVTLNLTINTVNATTTASNDTITASATGATYQWLDCDNNYAVISGATNQMFIATANGHYAVAVTQNGCTDTSACVTVTGVGIDENSLGADVKVYPNPTTGIIHIDPGKVTETIAVKITSIDGKVVYQGALKNDKVTNIMLDGEAGIYIVEIRSNTGNSSKHSIIKN